MRTLVRTTEDSHCRRISHKRKLLVYFQPQIKLNHDYIYVLLYVNVLNVRTSDKRVFNY